jgi:hypothetical protein
MRASSTISETKFILYGLEQTDLGLGAWGDEASQIVIKIRYGARPVGKSRKYARIEVSHVGA